MVKTEWEKPQYKKNEINWAGRILSKRKEGSEEDKTKARMILENWRASHSYPMHIFQMRLKRYSKKLDTEAIVPQRLKRTPSILRKLERSYDGKTPSMDLYQMQDIGGCRAILKDISLAKILYERNYLKGDLKHKRTGKKDYTTNPKKDGYRGFHLIYDYIGEGTKEYDGLKIEVQIRSKLQHLWATALETTDLITKQAMKFGMGKKEWHSLFLLISSAFAGLEGYDYLENTPNNEKELYLEIKNSEKQLNAIGKLEDFTTAIKRLSDNAGLNKNSRFFLLELELLSSGEGRLIISQYSEKDKDKAIREYSEKEKKNIDNKEYDVVLVSVDDAKDLQKAYPNYFADTKEFLTHLRKIVNKY